MRHGKKFNHLGRKVGHRRAMLSNMACSLIEHKQINTTTAKAKALRVYIEPLLTKSKDDSTHSRRVVFGYLQNKHVVTELFREIAPKIQDRPGGYTRIIKTGFRQGDGAEMAMIELVDFNEIYSPTEKKTKSRRRRKSSGSTEPKAAAAVEIAEEAEVIVEETPEVVEDVKVETSPEAEVTAEAAPEVKETEEKTESDEPKASSENESDSKEEKKD